MLITSSTLIHQSIDGCSVTNSGVKSLVYIKVAVCSTFEDGTMVD